MDADGRRDWLVELRRNPVPARRDIGQATAPADYRAVGIPPENTEVDRARKLAEETNVYELLRALREELPNAGRKE